jgi:hypothetical protein
MKTRGVPASLSGIVDERITGIDVLELESVDSIESLNNCSELIGEVAGPLGAEDKEKPRGANRAFTGAHYVLVVEGNPIHSGQIGSSRAFYTRKKNKF